MSTTYPCSARTADGEGVYTCQAPSGHDGDHRAHGGAATWPVSQDSEAARELARIRERSVADTGRTQAEQDRAALIERVDHLRAKHAATHAELMRRGDQLARLSGELSVLRKGGEEMGKIVAFNAALICEAIQDAHEEGPAAAIARLAAVVADVPEMAEDTRLTDQALEGALRADRQHRQTALTEEA